MSSTELLFDGKHLVIADPETADFSESKQIDSLRSQAQKIARQIGILEYVAKVRQALSTGWSRDPGKYSMLAYFVAKGGGEALIPELVAGKEVPGRYKVVPLAEVSTSACPACGTQQPLVVTYEQTRDSPSGDTWQKMWLVICCGGVRVLDSKTSPDRF